MVIIIIITFIWCYVLYVFLVLFSEKCFAQISGLSLHRDHARPRRWRRTWNLLLSSVWPFERSSLRLWKPSWCPGYQHTSSKAHLLCAVSAVFSGFLHQFLYLLHDLESVGSATGHPTVVSVKQRGSCFAFSPSKHRKEPLKAQYLKHLMERTDMNDFSKLKYLFFISHYNFLGFSQFSPWRSIYCHFHRKEWGLLVKGGTVSGNLNSQIQYYPTALLKL